MKKERAIGLGLILFAGICCVFALFLIGFMMFGNLPSGAIMGVHSLSIAMAAAVISFVLGRVYINK